MEVQVWDILLSLQDASIASYITRITSNRCVHSQVNMLLMISHNACTQIVPEGLHILETDWLVFFVYQWSGLEEL